MCGIVGYVGEKQCSNILLEGLRRLEYRGYDSAGIAMIEDNDLVVHKCKGRVDDLENKLNDHTLKGSCGISHTRWATHGEPSDENSHPHTNDFEDLALVHNGVIENYQLIKDKLISEGHKFSSHTDSEVLAHLISNNYKKLKSQEATDSLKTMRKAIKQSLLEIKGTYGIALIHKDFPDYIFGARLGSPLVLGIGKNENLLSSDASALIRHTKQVVYLNDYEMIVADKNNFEVYSLKGKRTSVSVKELDLTEDKIELGDYEHFMLKEIFEQPEALRNTLRGRLSHEDSSVVLGGLNMTSKEMRHIERVILCGCGTAYHSALVGEYIIESLARIPCEVEIASELRYRNFPLIRDTLMFVASQSGETIDSLAALREGQRKGVRVLGICNNVASTIARESDGGVYLHSGPEIGVAATKTFTSQLCVMTLIGLLFGRIHHLSNAEGIRFIKDIEKIPDQIRNILKQSDKIKKIAQKYVDSKGILFFGRLANYPIALEASLKLKEITYIHSSGYSSAELKHGIIALIDKDTPSVFIAPNDSVYEKNLSNIQEVKSRKGRVLVVTTEGKNELEKIADDVIYIPQCNELLSPLLTIIPLQLFAYHMAVILGKDVDKPRNLAKSVTVE